MDIHLSVCFKKFFYFIFKINYKKHTRNKDTYQCVFQKTIKFTRLETRTKESHLYARIRIFNIPIRNESENINYYRKIFFRTIMT